jgi:hypothetical protein
VLPARRASVSGNAAATATTSRLQAGKFRGKGPHAILRSARPRIVDILPSWNLTEEPMDCFLTHPYGKLRGCADATGFLESNQFEQMNKPNRVQSVRNKEVADEAVSSQPGAGRHGPRRFSIVAWWQRFRQLDWADRLNLILATILGCALVLALSPLLLVSWIWMQLAKHGLGVRRPGDLTTDRQA